MSRCHGIMCGAVCLLLGFPSLFSAVAPIPLPQFQPQQISEIGKGYGLAIADVDGDGMPDVLLADVWDFYWFRNGDWRKFHLAGRLDGQGAMAIAARDIDGDGRAEIAVCTRGPESAVYFLQRPSDPTQPWRPIRLPSEPEQHRIKWARDHRGTNHLISVPNLGRRNHLRARGLARDDGVKVYGYEFTLDPANQLRRTLLIDSLRDMHSFAVVPGRPAGPERLYFAGIEGIDLMGNRAERPWTPDGARLLPGMTQPVLRADGSLHAGIGEIDEGRTRERVFLATAEPKHGNVVAVYRQNAAGGYERQVLDDSLVTIHAVHCVDLLGLGRDQVVVGWWGEEARKNYGIRIYAPDDDSATRWTTYSIDEGTMACQSMQIADMDGDGRLDVVAAGWSTRNLVIYWNRLPTEQTLRAPTPAPGNLVHDRRQ